MPRLGKARTGFVGMQGAFVRESKDCLVSLWLACCFYCAA